MNTNQFKIFLRSILGLVLVITLAFGSVNQISAVGSIIYVKWNATGANNGASWTDAYTNLQSAIGTAISGESIWVAKGTYKPTTGTDQTVSFLLKNGVKIYGGFVGTETSLSQRKPAVNITILSGDIGTVGYSGDNSYNVVKGNYSNNTAVLDGFKITGGLAFGGSNYGGGIFNDNSSPTLRNLIISGNTAYYGGGIGNINNSNPILVNVFFIGNLAGGGVGVGGGMNNTNSNPSLRNVTFSDNKGSFGSCMYNSGNSNLTMTNVTFNHNGSTTFSTGCIYNDVSNLNLYNVTMSGNYSSSGIGGITAYGATNINIYNSIIWNNGSTNIAIESGATIAIHDSIVAGGCPAGATCSSVRNKNPLLKALKNNGGFTQTMALNYDSPAVDTGNDATCPTADQRGVPRTYGTSCDIGAYELKTGKKTFNSQAALDGWVLESGENTGIGGTMNNLATVLQLGDDSADKQYRAILSFGTAKIPDNAVIGKVILKVKKAGVIGTNPMTTHNGLVVDIKKGKFYTLPDLQINDFQAKPGKLKVGLFPKKLYSGWHRAVLYKTAHPYINKKGRTQLRLRFLMDDNDNNIADILKLYSGNAILANRPKLIVGYYIP